MKVVEKIPPRSFRVGSGAAEETLRDCGTVLLELNEQVTFMTRDGKEYDVVRKEWGFYATPSTTHRLKHFGLRAALVANLDQRLYIMLVEHDRMEVFERYCKADEQTVLLWLDDTATAHKLIAALGKSNDVGKEKAKP